MHPSFKKKQERTPKKKNREGEPERAGEREGGAFMGVGGMSLLSGGYDSLTKLKLNLGEASKPKVKIANLKAHGRTSATMICGTLSPL